MATDMSEEEFERELNAVAGQAGTEISYNDPNDADNYVTATAYINDAGRAWRHIESSGFNSPHMGAGNFGEWLDDNEDPADFGQEFAEPEE